jgi:hypothetical protein
MLLCPQKVFPPQETAGSYVFTKRLYLISKKEIKAVLPEN